MPICIHIYSWLGIFLVPLFKLSWCWNLHNDGLLLRLENNLKLVFIIILAILTTYGIPYQCMSFTCLRLHFGIMKLIIMMMQLASVHELSSCHLESFYKSAQCIKRCFPALYAVFNWLYTVAIACHGWSCGHQIFTMSGAIHIVEIYRLYW